jgi:hypothetical protein
MVAAVHAVIGPAATFAGIVGSFAVSVAAQA